MDNMPGTDHQQFITISSYYHLAIDLIILVLQIVSVFGNGFIIVLFIRSKKLRVNGGLSLIFLLSLTDWIFAVSAFPYIINYIIYWNPVQFDYNPYFLVISSLPLTIQFKINLVISLAIAIDRLQAIRYPLSYIWKKHTKQTWLVLAGGIFLASIDVTLEFIFTNIQHQPGCAAVGCFVGQIYKTYWGISNMVLNFLVVVTTTFVGCDLRKLAKRSNCEFSSTIAKKEAAQLLEASRLSFGILICSIIFLMFPSALVGIIEMAGFAVFKSFGPFYILGLLLVSVSNSFIYIWLHAGIRNAARGVFCKKNETTIVSVGAIHQRRITTVLPSVTVSYNTKSTNQNQTQGAITFYSWNKVYCHETPENQGEN